MPLGGSLFRLFGGSLFFGYRHDADELAVFPLMEQHGPGNLGINREISTHSSIFARMELRAVLADDNLAGFDHLTTKPFHAETL